MNNITVERVLSAYDAGVCKPFFGGWGDAETNCGCAMTAVAIHEGKDKFSSVADVIEAHDHSGSDEVYEVADVTWHYMAGFTDAFDSLPKIANSGDAPVAWTSDQTDNYTLGYEHGIAARDAVKAKYPKAG